MSHGPSTLGTIMTESRSPMPPTSVVMSSSAHGESRLLTRVQSGVSPKSTSRPICTRPSRAAIFLSAGIASSRLPRRMSAVRASSGSFANIFGLLGSKKWIIRDGRTGISVTGAGAPIASGLKKSRGLRITPSYNVRSSAQIRSREARASHVRRVETGAVLRHPRHHGVLVAQRVLQVCDGFALVARDRTAAERHRRRAGALVGNEPIEHEGVALDLRRRGHLDAALDELPIEIVERLLHAAKDRRRTRERARCATRHLIHRVRLEVLRETRPVVVDERFFEILRVGDETLQNRHREALLGIG